MLTDNVESDGLSIEPYELACWARRHDLSEGARDDLAESIARRLRRASLERIQTNVTGIVDDTDDEGETLPTGRGAARGKRLPIGDFVRRLRVTDRRVSMAAALRLLARIEARQWIPANRYRFELARYHETTRPGTIGALSDLLPAISTPAAIARAARLPWLKYVERDDLRLGSVDDAADSIWMQLAPTDAADFARRAWLSEAGRIDRLTLADEMVEVACLGALLSDGDRPAPGQLDSWIDAFAEPLRRPRRMPGAPSRPVSAILDALRGRSLELPALQRVLAASRALGATSDEDQDRQLRPLLGGDVGVGSARAFAQLVRAVLR